MMSTTLSIRRPENLELPSPLVTGKMPNAAPQLQIRPNQTLFPPVDATANLLLTFNCYDMRDSRIVVGCLRYNSLMYVITSPWSPRTGEVWGADDAAIYSSLCRTH